VVSEWHFKRAISTGVFSRPRSFRRHAKCPVVSARA
jgi:hypothetical protein